MEHSRTFPVGRPGFRLGDFPVHSSYPVTSNFGILQIRETDFTNDIFYVDFEESTPPWLSLRAGFLHQPFTTFNWLSTEKTPGTPFARMPAMFLSISLS